ISVRRYKSDFRRFLIEALRANGYEVLHVSIGRCNVLTDHHESKEYCGAVGLLQMIGRLRHICGGDKIVYIDSTDAVTPVRSILLRLALRAGTWCFDVYDNLLFDSHGYRYIKLRISIWLLALCSRILLVSSIETFRLFPNAWHLNNAADIPRVNREG